MIMDDRKEVMDVSGVAKYLGISRSKVYELIRKRGIPAFRIGRQYRFHKDVIDEWLRSKDIRIPGLFRDEKKGG